jgi:Flp pilus assembly protein TadD
LSALLPTDCRQAFRIYRIVLLDFCGLKSPLEALQAHTLGRKQAEKGSRDDALLFFRRAIELDPNFALAYAGLGIYYANQDDDLSTQYATRAFELRSHVSEREKAIHRYCLL